MCRAGGRRCPGSGAHGKATQAARQRKSRATRALRKAEAAGNTDAAQAVRARLEQATAEIAAYHDQHQQHTDTPQETTVPHDQSESHPGPTGRDGDVTPVPTHGHHTRPHPEVTVTGMAGHFGPAHTGQGDMHNNVRIVNNSHRHNPDTPVDAGDVTEPQVSIFTTSSGRVVNIAGPGSTVGIQAGTITGPLHIQHDGGSVSIGPGDAEHIQRNTERAAQRARERAERARERAERAGERAARGRHDTDSGETVVNTNQVYDVINNQVFLNGRRIR